MMAKGKGSLFVMFFLCLLIWTVGAHGQTPSGLRIVFNTSGKVHNIVVINPDGGGSEELTDETTDDYSPKWSPDGARIAFCSKREGDTNPALYVMDADGGNAVKIQEIADETCDQPDWSPDGKALVFTTRKAPPEIAYAIYRINPDGTGLAKLAAGMDGIWNADGTKVIYSDMESPDQAGRYKMKAVNPDGTGAAAFLDFNDLFPKEISADGGEMLVVGYFIPVEKIENATAGADGLFSTTSDGTGKLAPIFESTTMMTNPKGFVYYCSLGCSWSPDGKSIVYHKNTIDKPHGIYIANSDGSGERLLSESAEHPDWKK